MPAYELTAFCKWCQFESYDAIAEILTSLGLDGGDVVCRSESQITPANVAAELPKLKTAFDRAGLGLKTMVSEITAEDAAADRVLGVAADLGVERVRLGFLRLAPGQGYAARFEQARRELAGLEPLLRARRLRGSIQIHSGGFCLEVNTSAVRRLLDGFDPAVLGIQLDPGHLVVTGEPIPMALAIVGEYLHGVNLKSPRYETVADPETGRYEYRVAWVPLKDGMMDLPLLLRELRKINYAGALNLFCEYGCNFYHVEQDVAATTRLAGEDLRYLGKLLATD